LNKQRIKPVNISDDETLTIVDNRSEHKPTISDIPEKPDWLNDEIADWPFLTKEEAKKLIRNSNWANQVAP